MRVDQTGRRNDQEDRHHRSGTRDHRREQEKHIGDSTLAGDRRAGKRIGRKRCRRADENDAAEGLHQAVEQRLHGEGVLKHRRKVGERERLRNGKAEFSAGVERREEEPDEREREDGAE
ncbi:hypothetical protein D9M72_628920 [compost metagenome]